MSAVRAYNLDAAYASAKGKNADLIRLKIRQAQDLLKEIDALEFSLHNLSKKQIAGDRYENMRHGYENWQWEIFWREKCEKWQQQFGVHLWNCQSCHEENYMHHVEPTIGDQDELIRNLKYKLLYKSNCLAEEKKLIRHIKEAEEVRDTLDANPKLEVHRVYFIRIYLARQKKKMMHMKKVLDDLDSAGYNMSSLEKVQIRMDEKKIQVCKIIRDVVKLQDQKTTS